MKLTTDELYKALDPYPKNSENNERLKLNLFFCLELESDPQKLECMEKRFDLSITSWLLLLISYFDHDPGDLVDTLMPIIDDKDPEVDKYQNLRKEYYQNMQRQELTKQLEDQKSLIKQVISSFDSFRNQDTINQMIQQLHQEKEKWIEKYEKSQQKISELEKLLHEKDSKLLVNKKSIEDMTKEKNQANNHAMDLEGQLQLKNIKISEMSDQTKKLKMHTEDLEKEISQLKKEVKEKDIQISNSIAEEENIIDVAVEEVHRSPLILKIIKKYRQHQKEYKDIIRKEEEQAKQEDQKKSQKERSEFLKNYILDPEHSEEMVSLILNCDRQNWPLDELKRMAATKNLAELQSIKNKLDLFHEIKKENK